MLSNVSYLHAEFMLACAVLAFSTGKKPAAGGPRGNLRLHWVHSFRGQLQSPEDSRPDDHLSGLG